MFFRILLIVFGYATVCLTAAGAAAQFNRPHPSFDCGKADSSVELIICADAQLSEWDARMGRAYKLRRTRAVGAEQQVLAEAQRHWIASRNTQCSQPKLATAKPCILQMTKGRIEALGTPSSATTESDAVAPAATVAPTPSQTWDWCAGKDGASADLQIRACTTVIDADQETPENLAIAFGNRGNGYQVSGDYDRAVADYDQAIERNPLDPIVFSNRGIAYRSKGDFDRAITDFGQAIRLDPNFAEALANRGLLRFKKGDAGANDDITAALSLKPALAEEVMRQQALPITRQPNGKKATNLPTNNSSGEAGSTASSTSAVGWSSKKSDTVRPELGCPPDQRCH